jgi:hypothetical protein
VVGRIICCDQGRWEDVPRDDGATAAQRESKPTSYTFIHSSKRHSFAVLGLVKTPHPEPCLMHLVDHYCFRDASSSPLTPSLYPQSSKRGVVTDLQQELLELPAIVPDLVS